MMIYEAALIEQSVIEKKFGQKIKFTEGGFMDDGIGTPDFWNLLEEEFNRPIVSVRPSGRDGLDEVLVLLAKGYLDGKTRVLDYQTQDELETVLIDIFRECTNDEYEVFWHYKSTCPDEVWKAVDEWVHDTW